MLELDRKAIVPTRAYSYRLNKLCEFLFSTFGFRNATLYYVQRHQGCIIIHSSLSWAQYYIKNNCYAFDINLVEPDKMDDGCFWWFAHAKQSDFWEKVVQPAAALFDMHYGISIVKKHTDSYLLVSFTTAKEEISVQNKILNEIDCIKKFVAYLFQCFLPIITTRLEPYMLELSALKAYGHISNLGLFSRKPKTKRDKILLFVAIGLIPVQLRRISLSRRECECARLHLDGYTAKEAAEILNISRRTVEGHIANIKSKLRCRYKKELYEKFYFLKIFIS